MTIAGIGSNDDALDELMRIALHDDAIFAGSRLAFVGVAAEINRFSCVFRNKAPFHSSWETRTAAASKAARLGRFDHILRRKFVNDFAGCRVATQFNVSVDFFYTRIVDVLKEHTFIRHKKLIVAYGELVQLVRRRNAGLG